MRLSMLVLLLPLLMQQDGSGIVAMWCQIPLRKPLPKALQEGGLNLLGYRCNMPAISWAKCTNLILSGVRTIGSLHCGDASSVNATSGTMCCCIASCHN